MQSLNISSLTDNGLQFSANKIPEMKNISIFNINSMLAKLRIYPHSFWFPMKVKTFLTMGSPIVAISIIALPFGLYCKCFQNRMSCVCKYTRPTSLPVNDTHTELEQISDPLSDISDQLSPQIIQEILKASGVDFSKVEPYICHKTKHHTALQATKITLN